MSDTSNVTMYSTVHVTHYCLCMSNRSNTTVLALFSAIRTVAEGHQMIADGWRLFEDAVASVGAGDLPQLLRAVRTMTTPTPPPPPPPPPAGQQEQASQLMDVTPGASGTSQPSQPVASPVKREGGDEPVVVLVGGVRNWACPMCNTVRGSRNGCDAHIRQTHTGKVLLCALCSFSTYNLDSLQRHAKTHN